MQTKLIKASVLALTVAVMGGCADTATMDQVKATADAAMAKANDAYNLAQTAHTIASEAAYAADQADKDAKAALQCCNDNSAKLDKMFEKAMMK